MKPAAIVADEMFPEGAGPYMDIEEVCKVFCLFKCRIEDTQGMFFVIKDVER